MFKPLIDSYSAVLKKFKGKDIGATINEEVNIDRLKTMYDGYDGDRVIEIRFIDPRRFTVQQRNFIYALIGERTSGRNSSTSVSKVSQGAK